MAGDFNDDRTQDDGALADAQRFGMSDEEIANLRQSLGQQSGRSLWRRHLNAFMALMAGATQWRHSLSVRDGQLVERVVGLDYTALKVALDALGMALTPVEWQQLTILEAAAIGAKNGAPAPIFEGA